MMKVTLYVNLNCTSQCTEYRIDSQAWESSGKVAAKTIDRNTFLLTL